MSCAVMFQPCLSTESPLSAPHSKSDVESPPQTLLSSAPSYQGGTMPQVHHDAYLMHQHQQSALEHQRFHASKSARRSPVGDEKDSGKAVKKLCTSIREPHCSSLPHHIAAPQEPQTKQHSPISITSAPQSNTESNIKYVSANCVVVTHYSGDTASVVDEHFSRALSGKCSTSCESNFKITTRSFPASFYQPQVLPRPALGLGGSLGAHTSSELYEAYHGGLHSIQHPGSDPWAYAFSSQVGKYGAYSHRAVGHDMYHSAMNPTSHYQYSSLGLPQHFSRIPSVPVPSQMVKSDSWGSRYYETFGGSADFSSGIDASSYMSSTPHYHHNVTGLEAGMVSETSKDHYWL